MTRLQESLGDDAFDESTLLPREVQLPCAASEESQGLSKCTLIAFRHVLPIHTGIISRHCEFTPLNFFKMRQLTYDNSPDHLEFSHMVHRDLSSTVHDATAIRYSSTSPQTGSGLFGGAAKLKNRLLGRSQRRAELPVLTKSQEALASNPAFAYNQFDGISFETIRKMSSGTSATTPKELEGDGPKSLNQHHVFGCIMVSQEVSINVQEVCFTRSLFSM